MNQAHLENSRFKYIETHLAKELVLNGLEAPDELQMNTVTRPQQNQILRNTDQHATT